MSLDKKEIYRQIILSNYSQPNHMVEIKTFVAKGYQKAKLDSNSCIDNITCFVKIKNKKIVEAYFGGNACAIATASTNIMTNLIIGKTINKAIEIINNYLLMIDGKKYNTKLLGDLEAFQDLNKQINRINCGIIGIKALRNAITNEKK